MPGLSEERLGDWRVICDYSGFKCWASETVLQWNGLRVLRRFADLRRHPQDFVRGIPDKPQVPWTRPEAADVSISPYIEDSDGLSILDENSMALVEG